MTSAVHKTKSLSAYLPIEIIAQHTGTGKVMAGPLAGRLFDISKNGACLIISQIMHEKYHLFYSTQENSLLSLQLFIDLPPDIENLKIPAHPLWFNLFQQGQIRNFIMGVEFPPKAGEEKIRKLLATVKRHRKKRHESWRLRPQALFAAGTLNPFYFFSIPKTLNVGTENCTPFKTSFPTSFNSTC